MKIKQNHFFFLLALLATAFLAGKYLYLKPSVSDAEKAPDFAAKLPDGNPFQLSDLQGKYVLLDFWGSWCGPCLQETPGLIALHQKYERTKFRQADGLALVSVAIEKDEKRWRNALQRHGLSWHHQILDLATSLKFFDSPIARQFGVRQLPTKFLINEKGVIIIVNPSVEEVAAFLETQL